MHSPFMIVRGALQFFEGCSLPIHLPAKYIPSFGHRQTPPIIDRGYPQLLLFKFWPSELPDDDPKLKPTFDPEVSGDWLLGEE